MMKSLLFSCVLLLSIAFFQVTLGISTRKEAQTYLLRYGIPYDEIEDAQLLQTVKQYRDMAVLNTELFGDRVERVLEGLDKKLEDQYALLEPHQRQRLLKDIERVLRQLEVHGQLTRDHVHEQLTNVNNKVAVSSSHFLDPEQWQQVIKDVEETVTPPSTWSSWFGKSTSPIRIGDKDPYRIWLDETTVPFASWLSLRQHEQLKEALDKAMKRQELGSKDWWRQLVKALETQGFTTDDIEKVIDQLRIKVVGFRVFTHDYLGLPTPPPVYQDETTWLDSSDYAVVNWVHRYVCSPFHDLMARLRNYGQQLDEQKEHVQDEWSKAIQNAKHSFATYWHDREYDAYRRIGYTEGEIDWVRTYLQKNLHHTSPRSFNQIVDDVRKYLNSLERQTKAQVELHVLKLERLLQAWKLSILAHGHGEL